MTAAELSALMKKGALSGGYLFCGEEGYLRNRYVQQLRKLLLPEADLDAFNHIRFDMDSYSPSALRNSLEALPVCAEKKLIEIREIRIDEMTEEEFSELCAVLRTLDDFEYCVLVMNFAPSELDVSRPKQPTKRFRALSELVQTVLFEKETPVKLNKWLLSHFTAEGISSTPGLCEELMERSGHDMYTLASESEKLCAYLHFQGRTELKSEDIALVASPVLETEPFDFSNAIQNGDTASALAILADKQARREKPEMILPVISGVICTLVQVKTLAESGMSPSEIGAKLGMHEYRVRLALAAASKRKPDALRGALILCGEADRRLKSTPLDRYVILQRLVCEIAVGATLPEGEDDEEG